MTLSVGSSVLHLRAYLLGFSSFIDQIRNATKIYDRDNKYGFWMGVGHAQGVGWGGVVCVCVGGGGAYPHAALGTTEV